jgi:hypothetical protein
MRSNKLAFLASQLTGDEHEKALHFVSIVVLPRFPASNGSRR